jgi:hypothetical protein
LLVYLLLCIVSVLTGLGLLGLLKLVLADRPYLLLAPVTALVFWSLVLGTAGALRLPIKDIAPWLWLATLLLMLNGLFHLWRKPRTFTPLLMLCALLPIAVMARYFWNGITEYTANIAADGWSYVAFGQYLWEYPRGADGGLAPLYQYAAHVSEARYISATLLGFFSILVRAGDTATVSSLLQAWTLFNMACAIALFWVSEKRKLWVVAVATTLSVMASWIADLIWINNFDNGLALVYMPVLAAIISLIDVRDLRWWLFIGGFVAAIFYTYPEFALIIIFGTVLITLPRIWKERSVLLIWLQNSAIALLTAAILLIPTNGAMVAFGWRQITFGSSSTSQNRPAGGVFGGILMSKFQPAAFWGLGAEHAINQHRRYRNLLGCVLSLLAVLGVAVLVQQNRWGIVAITLVLIVGAAHFVVLQRYSYGAYKIMVLNWWCLIISVITAVEWIVMHAESLWLKRVIGVSLALGCLVILFQSNHTSPEIMSRYLASSNLNLDARQFRQVQAVKGIIGQQPLVVMVDEWLANIWAVYYLRDAQIDLRTYRMLMAQVHVIPYMERARRVPVGETTYILTDNRSYGTFDGIQRWEMVWSGGPYRLWKPSSGEWAVVTDITNANGIEQVDGEQFFWLGNGDTTLRTLVGKRGVLSIGATFWPGGSVPNSDSRALLVTTDTGYQQQVILKYGDGVITLPVEAGGNKIILRPLDQATVTKHPNGDTRPLVLGIKGMTLSVSEAPRVLRKLHSRRGWRPWPDRAGTTARSDDGRTDAVQAAGAREARAEPGERNSPEGVGVFGPGGARATGQVMVAFIEAEPICAVPPIAPSLYCAGRSRAPAGASAARRQSRVA